MYNNRQCISFSEASMLMQAKGNKGVIANLNKYIKDQFIYLYPQ